VNAPAWLPDILAAVMIAIAAFHLWRLSVTRTFAARSDYELDVLLILLALATAGMLEHWIHLLTPGAWATILAVAGAWFVLRAVTRSRAAGVDGAAGTNAAAGANAGAGVDRAAGPSVRSSVAAAVGCAVAVYMLLAGVAPSTLSGSTAGQYTMAGMPGMTVDSTITWPTLGIAFSVLLAVYAVAALDQISRPDSASSGLVTDSGPVRQRGAAAVLAPRTAALCRIALAVTMAYAILAKLV